MEKLFGTDGVRGIANAELDCEKAMAIGRATAFVLSRKLKKPPLFIIGADTRISSDMLAAAVSAGICSSGGSVLSVGVLPTPAVAYLVGRLGADAGIMISASHNPFEYNGIKIFDNRGFKLSDDFEREIEGLVLKNIKLPLSHSVGSILPDRNALESYIDHLASTTDQSFNGLSIAVDSANGASYLSAERLFSRLGAKVYMLSNTPNGTNINEACGSTHIDALRDFVLKNKLDFGVAFDGDADRAICVDEKGGIVDGDTILAICALDLKSQGRLAKNTVVGTVMTNLGFVRFCQENDINFVSTSVGDKFVLEEAEKNGYILGGEQSGHIIFRQYATTGDGQLTAIRLLSVMKREEKSLSALASLVKKVPQATTSVKVSPSARARFYTDEEIKKAIEGASAELGENGRILVRPSGTEPLIRIMVEGDDGCAIKEIAKRVANTIKERLCGK